MPKSGRVYADTPHNRSLSRVGQAFGSAVEPKADDAGEGGSGQGNDKKVENGTKEIGTLDKNVGKSGEEDLGPGPCPRGHRTGDTRRRKGEVLSVEEVNRRLQALGIPLKKLKKPEACLAWEREEKVSKCVRAAIQRGYIELKGEDKEELNQVIFQCKFPDWTCGHSKDVKLCDVLYQPDYGGDDYEDGSLNATVVCEEPDCKRKKEEDYGHGQGRTYLTNICEGRPSEDSGKFHNHCPECPGFGVCIGDYREAHCHKCNKHYFLGGRGFNCPCQVRAGKGRYEDSDQEDSDQDCVIM